MMELMRDSANDAKYKNKLLVWLDQLPSIRESKDKEIEWFVNGKLDAVFDKHSVLNAIDYQKAVYGKYKGSEFLIIDYKDLKKIKETNEFWIKESTGQGEDVTMHKSLPKYWPTPLKPPFYHTIEYSAYEAIKAERDRYRDALEFYADCTNWTQRDDYSTSRSFIDERDIDKGWNKEIGFTTKVGGKTARQALKANNDS